MFLAGSLNNMAGAKSKNWYALFFLLMILLVLNFKTIFWWFGPIDSPNVLIQALLYAPIEYFTSPEKYQLLTDSNVTPWVTLSWDIDYSLFQMNALGYRAHHLLSFLVMEAVLFIVILRVTHSLAITFVFSLACATTPAAFEVLDFLVDRHYLEGALFGLLSLLFASLYNERRDIHWLLFSVLFYGLSTTAKEIYVPLPGVLFFLFSGGLRQRLMVLSPYAIVTLVYLAWRVHLLDGSVGGYGSSGAFENLLASPILVIKTIAIVFQSFFVNKITSLLLISLFLLLLVLNFRKLALNIKLGFLMGAFCLALPLAALMPVLSIGMIAQRWFFLPVIGLLIFFAYLCSITTSKRLARLACFSVLLVSLFSIVERLFEPPFWYAKTEVLLNEILKADPEAYIVTNHNNLISYSDVGWVYLSKLLSGKWGTQVVSNRGQLAYHAVETKHPIIVGTRTDSSFDLGGKIEPVADLIKGVNHNIDKNLLEIDLDDSLKEKICFIYIFSENNGMLIEKKDCSQWSESYSYIIRATRFMSDSFSDINIAVWSDQLPAPVYSKPYELGLLLNAAEK